MNTHEEYQYLNLIKNILETGVKKDNRTDVQTINKFGAFMRFSLKKDIFPLLTTKKIFWKGVVEELLWFIKGDTNSNHLSEKGVKIWDKNGSREFLDSCGFTNRKVGDLGPIYGFSWRHFGADYENMDSDYTGKGIDQLKECINLIKNDPDSRRIIMTAWNPKDLNKLVLPPCHLLCQFQVCNGELNCLMTQRSCDVCLGVPFNIASYSLLTCIIAHSCNLKPGEFIHSMGDVHIYVNHIDAVKEQLKREPKNFPKLIFKCEPKDIDEYTFEDFEIVDYNPHPAIKMDMVL